MIIAWRQVGPVAWREEGGRPKFGGGCFRRTPGQELGNQLINTSRNQGQEHCKTPSMTMLLHCLSLATRCLRYRLQCWIYAVTMAYPLTLTTPHSTTLHHTTPHHTTPHHTTQHHTTLRWRKRSTFSSRRKVLTDRPVRHMWITCRDRLMRGRNNGWLNSHKRYDAVVPHPPVLIALDPGRGTISYHFWYNFLSPVFCCILLCILLYSEKSSKYAVFCRILKV